MNKEIKESVISGPLLHWTKVAILNDSLVKLKHSSIVAHETINAVRIAAHNKEISEEEGQLTVTQFHEIMKLNATNILKTKELLRRAIELVPEGMRSWSTSN